MKNYDPSTCHAIIDVADFNEALAFPAEKLAELGKLYRKEVMDALKKEGFRRVRDTRAGSLFGLLKSKEKAGQPDFIAEKDGRACCICMPPVAEMVLTVEALSAEQCRYCDEHYADADVYHAALFLYQDQKLQLMAPFLVKEKGKWLTIDRSTTQFLPVSITKDQDVFSLTLGGLGLFKMFNVIIPQTIRKGTEPVFYIDGLIEGKVKAEEPVKILMSGIPDFWMGVIKRQEDGNLAFMRPFLHMEGEPRMELEFLSINEKHDSVDGVVNLMDSSGNIWCAECLEAIAIPSLLPRGRHFMTTLSMIATRFDSMQEEIEVTSGPLYEMSVREYKEEHGCEPPADFSLKISTKSLRHTHQEEDDTHLLMCGNIVAVTESICGGLFCYIVDVAATHDDSPLMVKVMLFPALLNGYVPTVGDNILCTGVLQASFAEACAEDTPSWQDSAEVAEAQTGRINSAEALRAYLQYGKVSLAYALVAEAYLNAGWEIVHVEDRNFSRVRPSMVVRNQLGEEVMVAIDTVINGDAGEYSFESVRSKISENLNIHFATVELTWQEKEQMYRVSARILPETAGVTVHAISIRQPFFRSTLVLNDGEEPRSEERYPEKLDEKHAAELFLRAMRDGEWEALAEMMTEHMLYRSETVQKQSVGKMEFLRYMCERVENWKENDMWGNFSFKIGSVYDGQRRRPCMATCHQGKPTAIAVFDDFNGMIGGMLTLSYEHYSSFRTPNAPDSMDE